MCDRRFVEVVELQVYARVQDALLWRRDRRTVVAQPRDPRLDELLDAIDQVEMGADLREPLLETVGKVAQAACPSKAALTYSILPCNSDRVFAASDVVTSLNASLASQVEVSGTLSKRSGFS